MSEREQQNSQMEGAVSERPNTDELEEIASLGTQPSSINTYAGEILEAVVAGNIHLEITPTLAESGAALAPDTFLEAGKARLTIGGPASNIGLALHTLGMPTRLMGKVGKDLFGQAIFQVLSTYGEDLARGMVIAVDEASSYSVLVQPAGVKPLTLHFPGCNASFSAEDVPYKLLESTGLFHFGYPLFMAHLYEGHGEELASIFQRVKVLNVTTSLDLSLSQLNTQRMKADWQQILVTTLPAVDIFLADIEELLQALRRPLYEKLTTKAGKVNLVDRIDPDIISELGQELLEMGVKIVGIKLGHRGIYLASTSLERLAYMGRAQPTRLQTWGNRELWAPCFISDLASTTASGDAATAGFLMGILRGMGPEATLAAACAISASSVEGEGTVGGLRSWPETMERIAAGWPRLLPEKKRKKQSPLLDMAAHQWHWDESYELWSGPRDQVI